MGRHLIGSGVGIASVNRIRDLFLDGRMARAQSDLGRAGTMATSIKQMEAVFNEPGDAGIANALGKFFDAWSSLASNPNQAAARLQVQMAGQTLTDRIRNTYHELVRQQTQIQQDITGTFDQIDRLTGEINTLNAEIRSQSATGAVPNDLMDRRDLAIENLSKLIDVRTSQFEDGTTAVYTRQFTLVDSVGNYAIPRNYDASAQTLSDGTLTYSVPTGKLAGQFGALRQSGQYLTQLDGLADELRAQINTAHMGGIAPNGATGYRFFFEDTSATPVTGASNFDLALEVKTSASNIASGTTGNGADGSLALQFSRLRQSNLAALGNKTFEGYYRDFISSIGTDALFQSNSADTQSAMIAQIDNQRQSVSGVSIDDEMANMLRFQRSYQAAARALSIFDQVTEDLLGIIR